MAESYDQTFTNTSLGRELRALVWERLSLLFTGGSHVLELNCGTGEDACWLAARGVLVTATDGSPRMLQRAEEKASAQLASEAWPLPPAVRMVHLLVSSHEAAAFPNS